MKIKIIITLIVSLLTITLYSQSMKIMTYNVENFFDTKHDTLKNDREFTPQSDLNWNNHRFYNKLHEVMQVIVGVGNEEPPALVGLCEIENDYVLKAMTTFSPYNQLNYGYIHYESPDARGIDVALLYQKDKFLPLSSRPIPIILPNGNEGRDLLYVCGMFNDVMIHIIQIHFPSRREGALASQPNRIAAGEQLNNAIDSIKQVDPNPSIIIMGDFNDNPSDFVPTTTLRAYPNVNANYESSQLYNLCWDGYEYVDRKEGSYFHAGRWDLLDQIIVSGNLLNNTLPLSIYPKAIIYNAEWITKEDKKTGDLIPNRTYAGPHYIGGVSDHFPVYVELNIK